MRAAKVKEMQLPLGRRLRKDMHRNKTAYLLFVPILVWYILFQYLPLANIVVAFQDYNIYRGISGSEWVGFENFIKFFQLRTFSRLVRNTIMLSFYGILFDFPAPIFLALMLNEVRLPKVKRVMQTVSYMPHFISLVVVCGIIRDFCASDGLINQLRLLLGANETYNLLGDAKLYRTIHITSSVWQNCGWASIVYLAALSTIDSSLYEAAYIDGASRMQRILHVTLPGLLPVITVQFIMRLGNIMSVGYEKIILLYNSLTYETADVISTYLYRYGLLNGKYSMATAIGLFNSLINIAILVFVNNMFRRFTEESLW